MGIALVAIMQDEGEYVDRWLGGLSRFRSNFDEVLVVDGGSTDETVPKLQRGEITVLHLPFTGDFSTQRNYACDHVQSDWIFELDADEVASIGLLAGLPAITKDAAISGVDCVGIARLNFLDQTLVASPGYRGLDYQYRLHRKPCRWYGRVHEELRGYHARVELDFLEGHFLVHSKSSARHAARNAVYRQMEGT